MKRQGKRTDQKVAATFWSARLVILLISLPLYISAKALSDWDYYQQSGHKSPKWDALVEAGFDTFESGNVETAVNFIKRAMALGCKDGLVFYKLTLIIESGGNLKGALEMLEKGAPLLKEQYGKHPVAKELAEHLGRLYYQLDRYDEALAQFLEAIQTDGENFLRLYLTGQIYRMQQKFAEAIPYFEKSLRHPPPAGSPGNMKLLAYIELMQVYSQVKEFDKALIVANEILKQDPANPAARTLHDQIRQQKMKEEERKAWKKMMETH